jgi:hypothetical protein
MPLLMASWHNSCEEFFDSIQKHLRLQLRLLLMASSLTFQNPPGRFAPCVALLPAQRACKGRSAQPMGICWVCAGFVVAAGFGCYWFLGLLFI